jgi:hypothetical protein
VDLSYDKQRADDEATVTVFRKETELLLAVRIRK